MDQINVVNPKRTTSNFRGLETPIPGELMDGLLLLDLPGLILRKQSTVFKKSLAENIVIPFVSNTKRSKRPILPKYIIKNHVYQ